MGLCKALWVTVCDGHIWAHSSRLDRLVRRVLEHISLKCFWRGGLKETGGCESPDGMRRSVYNNLTGRRRSESQHHTARLSLSRSISLSVFLSSLFSPLSLAAHPFYTINVLFLILSFPLLHFTTRGSQRFSSCEEF